MVVHRNLELPTLIIYGVTLLAVCYLTGVVLGRTLGSLLGLDADVGGVGIAMVEGPDVNRAYLDEGTWAVDIGGKVYPAKVSLQPFYDPASVRVRS